MGKVSGNKSPALSDQDGPSDVHVGTWHNLLNSNLGKTTALFSSINDMLHNSE